MPLHERFEFRHVDQASGSIVIAEGERDVPFPIRRIYFIHGVPAQTSRGGHAHWTLLQIAVCARGSCRVHLDDGTQTADIVLSKPNEGVLFSPLVWHEMSEFSSDCVFLVLASAHYDERDYIRTYDEFKHAVASR